MLQLKIPDIELYDELNNRFITRKGTVLTMEHSLLSLAKWESKWHIPFLTENDLTVDQTIDYYRCMTITKNVNPDVYKNITNDISKEINKYIDDPMTATWFNNVSNNQTDKTVITAEIIYYQMISLGIPFECEKWHLNRLLTLIRVVSLKNSPPKKMSRDEIMAQQVRLNEERKAKLNTKG